MTETSTSLTLGPFEIDPATGDLSGEGEPCRLEPKVMELLLCLGQANGSVVSREELFSAVWPGVTVGEDTLTRAIFKLRRALGDDPKAPRFVETVPKRGYRLLVPLVVAEPAPVPTTPSSHRRWWWGAGAAASLALALGLLGFSGSSPGPDQDIERATDRYMQFTRQDNEAAIELYNRVLGERPSSAGAQSGLAAALVQRVVRWPDTIGSEAAGTDSISSALDLGLTSSPEAELTLSRARDLAERSVRTQPRNVDAWRILGLVRSAQKDRAGAFEAYEEGLKQDPQNWEILINVSELHTMEGNNDRAYAAMVRAYGAMGATYLEEPQRIGPWRAPLGVRLAERDERAGRMADAEAWYRQTLADEPLFEPATLGLAGLLRDLGRGDEADALCDDYARRTGEEGCGTS